MQQALGTQQVQHQQNISQILSASNAESMNLSEHSLKLNTMSRSVRAKEQSTQDADMKAQLKRQPEEIEDLKHRVKQSKIDMDRSIKIVQHPAVAKASQTEATIQPVVEKVLEDIRE